MRPRHCFVAWLVATALTICAAVTPSIAQSPPAPSAAVEQAIEQGAATARGTTAGQTAALTRVGLAAELAQLVVTARGQAVQGELADAREREALDRLAQAREREERERNATLLNLRIQEREIAEQLLSETREHSARLAEIYAKSRSHLSQVSERKAELIDALDALGEPLTQKRRRDEVDPLFDQVLELRTQAHDRFRRALRASNEAQRTLRQLSTASDEADAKLAGARGRSESLDASSLWERRVAVAQAESELAGQRELHQRELLEAHRDRVRDYHSQFGFFAGTIEPLLQRISDERHRAYFDLGDTQNWEMASDALGTGLRALEERGEYRLEQFSSSGLWTLEFLAWLWRLAWGLVVVLLLTVVVVRFTIWLVERLCAGLLRRRLVGRRATSLVKLAEVLRAISRATLYYVGVAYAADYAAESIPELLGVAWVVDAVFIYWCITQAARVIIFPRTHRTEKGASEELRRIAESHDPQRAVEITGVDLARAQKLLNSIRVVTAFWLLAAYIPDFTKPLTGITVLWWLLDRAATWGFVVVVYWVLSRWRHEIAALFEKLAGERLAAAAVFVQRHKTRPWGVLVIAVASLYVLARETATVVQRYVLETNIFRRLNAFAFRTQVEMQNRARDEDAKSVTAPREPLDPSYLAFFEERPLDDEEYRCEREGILEPVWSQFDIWERKDRRGSVAISGESGVGKTTLLHQIARRCAEVAEFPIVRAQFVDRLTSRDAIVAFIAGIFGLEEPPASQDELVATLRTLDRRVVLIDDCELCFLRHINHFDALDALLDIVHLCDGRHFFVLAFDRHAWTYIDRVEERGHLFGVVLNVPAWRRNELQQLFEKRNDASGYSASFARLVAAHAGYDDRGESFDVIETARGYFDYLHEFSGGIPRVAILYWLESLVPSSRERVLDVDLFRRPSSPLRGRVTDDEWFVLAALVQHGGLTAQELAEVIDRPHGFCARVLDYFAEHDVVRMDESGRATVGARHWRDVLRRLAASRFLFGA